LVATCKLFLENPNLISTPYRVRSRASEAHFRLFLAAIEGAMTAIGLDNVIDLGSLSKEFEFVDLGRRVAEFVSQHPSVEVARLKWAIANLQKQVAEQNRQLCLLSVIPERSRSEQDSQVREAIDAVKREQRHGRKRISDLQEEVRRQIDGVVIMFTQSDEVLKRRVRQLERRLAEGDPKVNDHLATVQRELAVMKEEIRVMKPKHESLVQPAALQRAETRFPPCVRKGNQFEVPHGIIAHLTRVCGGNVHERKVVEVTSGSFEKQPRQPLEELSQKMLPI
jgi:hypothetical protein